MVKSYIGGQVGKCENENCGKENRTLWQVVKDSRGQGKKVCGVCKEKGVLE